MDRRTFVGGLLAGLSVTSWGRWGTDRAEAAEPPPDKAGAGAGGAVAIASANGLEIGRAHV